jgi:hypothetical protein
MTDPTSFGTAVTVLGVVAAMVIAFGLAILSDMAMRRREDRSAATAQRTSPRVHGPRREDPRS